MGKVKRARQKAHNAAVKIQISSAEKKRDLLTDTTASSPQTVPVLGENVFAGIDLRKYNLSTKLPEDFDTRSAITSKSLKELKMKKKDKQKLRHDLFIQKLNVTEAIKKKDKEKKKKQQTPVVGDIGSLAEALPTLDLLLKDSTGGKSKRHTSGKTKSTQKAKKRQTQMLQDISVFQKVLKHPSYKENPTETISEHLRNWQKQEDMDET